MSSRRIYITLNSDKEKDKIIEKYLSQSYSEADAIKEAIYRLATNNMEKELNNTISTERVQKITNNDNKVLNDIKVDLSVNDEAVEIKKDSKYKSEELKQKKLKALKQFM